MRHRLALAVLLALAAPAGAVEEISIAILRTSPDVARAIEISPARGGDLLVAGLRDQTVVPLDTARIQPTLNQEKALVYETGDTKGWRIAHKAINLDRTALTVSRGTGNLPKRAPRQNPQLRFGRVESAGTQAPPPFGPAEFEIVLSPQKTRYVGFLRDADGSGLVVAIERGGPVTLSTLGCECKPR